MSNRQHNLALAFADVAHAHADRVAIYSEDGHKTTYLELHHLSNQLARYFLRLGLNRYDVLGLFHDKSALGYAVMLACLKLGAVVVNLDDANPPARLTQILSTAKPKLLVSASAVMPTVELIDCDGLCLVLASDTNLAWKAESSADLLSSAAICGTDPAYLMYTSGSTGVPKGAVISHGAVMRFIHWIKSRFSITTSDVFTGLNPAYFDNSVFDFYGSLFNGASLAPLTRKTVQNPQLMLAQIERARCTIWFSVPSLLVYLYTVKALRNESLSTVRCLVFGGEGFPKNVLAHLYEQYRRRMQLINVYGPTECTCICSAHDVVDDDFKNMSGLVTLGQLNPDFIGWVFDERGQTVLEGEIGELWLGGANVGLGYYNNAEKTAQSFVQNPRQSCYREVLYRTGDLVRKNEQGNFEFIGRCDNQIKHLGYRIELEEIEAALCRLSYVDQAAVIYRRTHAEFGQIEAYLRAETDLTEAQLRAELRTFLPDYMIPRRITVMSDLPKNANGKVDRKALLMMHKESALLGVS